MKVCGTGDFCDSISTGEPTYTFDAMFKVGVRSVAAALPIWLLANIPVSAETRVTISNGRVTVSANDATVRQILDEWARVGGTTVVNVDRISDARVTLE